MTPRGQLQRISSKVMEGHSVRRAVVTKAPLRVQFLLTFFWGGGGEGQEASEGSIESQQKFDFFSYDITPK